MLAYVGLSQNLKDLMAPLEDHPLTARCEPPALEGWMHEIFYCARQESGDFLLIVSVEGSKSFGVVFRRGDRKSETTLVK